MSGQDGAECLFQWLPTDWKAHGVWYVYGPRNELELFQDLSDTYFTNVAPVFAAILLSGTAILTAATPSPFLYHFIL